VQAAVTPVFLSKPEAHEAYETSLSGILTDPWPRLAHGQFLVWWTILAASLAKPDDDRERAGRKAKSENK